MKRSLGLTTSRKHRYRNVDKKTGTKTFSTEENAKKHADLLKLEEGKYTIVPAKKNKRFKIEA